MIIESGDSLESTHLRLEIVSASSMPNVTFDRHYDVSQSLDMSNNSPSLSVSSRFVWTEVGGSLSLNSRRSLVFQSKN